MREVRFVRCCCVDDLNGRVGVECRRYRSHASALLRGTKSALRMREQNKWRKHMWHTYFVQYEDEFFALVLSPPHFLFDQAAPAALGVPCVEHQDDDVGLFDDLV